MERNYRTLDELGRRAELILYQHMSAPEVAHVLGISTTSVWRHAAEAGFKKREDPGVPPECVAAPEAVEEEAPRPPVSQVDPDRPPLSIAETALRQAVEAFEGGRHAEAIAIIKAGNAVGEFAEFVRVMREGEGGRDGEGEERMP